MKVLHISLVILVLAATVYWLFTGNAQFLPFVMLITAAMMLLMAYEQFSNSRKSIGAYLAVAGFILFAAYGISLFIS